MYHIDLSSLITVYTCTGVVFGFETTEYSVFESQGVLEVNVLKLTETTEISAVTLSTQDVLLCKSSTVYNSLHDVVL